ncbi:MAG TPA: hypothetical protein VF597_00925 [Candidatus Saccharimonadales bacterium]
MRKFFIILTALGVVSLGLVVGLLAGKATHDEFRVAERSVTGFQPYYFSQLPVAGFSLAKGSVSFTDGVLVFTLVNDVDKTLVFTEQKTPSAFDIGSLRGDKDFKTLYGQAYITDGQSRTTGTLLTDDNTWILINAPRPIGADSMQTILNSLRKSSP